MIAGVAVFDRELCVLKLEAEDERNLEQIRALTLGEHGEHLINMHRLATLPALASTMASLRSGLRLYRSGRGLCERSVGVRLTLNILRRSQSTQQATIVQDQEQSGAAFAKPSPRSKEPYAEPSQGSLERTTQAFSSEDDGKALDGRTGYEERGLEEHVIASAATANSGSLRITFDAPRTHTKTLKRTGSVDQSNGTNTAEKADYRENQVNLKIGKRLRAYDPIFVRDCCTCPKCVDQSTRQKLFSTTDISADISVKDMREDGDVVHFTWTNDLPGFDADHVTTINIKSLSRSVRRHPVKLYKESKTLWNAKAFEEGQTKFDYEEYMTKDSTLLLALEQLHRYGMVFVSNVPEAEASVSDVATRIGPLKNTFYGSTWDVRSVAEAKNVAYTSQDLGFHMDLLYMHQPPRLQLLHCLKASTEGGTSLFSDSYLAASSLFHSDRYLFDCLAKNDVNFHYDNDSQQYHQSRRVFQLVGDAHPNPNTKSFGSLLEAVNWSPPFQGPFHNVKGDHFLASHVHRWHKAARAFRDLVEAKSAVHQRQMPPGECVIFDNRRVLHARTAFSGGERWLRGCYLDSDPFVSKTRVLQRKFGAVGYRNESFDHETQI